MLEDSPNDWMQACSSSSQLAPLVNCPRDIITFTWVIWARLGLSWNLGRWRGEPLDTEAHAGESRLEWGDRGGRERQNEMGSVSWLARVIV